MMVLPRNQDGRRPGGESPRRVAGNGRTDYELFEKDGEYVLSIELPGYDRDEIDVAWDDGRLSVVADHEADRAERRRSYQRTFRMPSEIADEDIRARYQRGILDVYLPTTMEGQSGKSIPIQSPAESSG